MARRGSLLSVVLVAAFIAPAARAIPLPTSDPFYTPPQHLGRYHPGAILRSRRVTLKGATNLASGTAYQLLYRTTVATGRPIATVTTLMLPSIPVLGPRRLLSYQTAEDSLTQKCAPSYTLQSGSGSTQNAESFEMAQGLINGWDVVVPDYEGPRSEWAVGPLEGRTTLDSIRAVEHFPPAMLQGPRTEVAMMGYSGGAIPTVWANAIASRYAPKLQIVGDAAGGIAADPIENLVAVNGSAFAGAIIGVSVAVNRAYPQLRLSSLLNAKGRALAVQDGNDESGCAGSVTNAPFGKISDYSNYATPQAIAAVRRVRKTFAKLDLITGPVPRAPSYWYNAIHDELAIIRPVDELFAADCARGATIDYYRDPAVEHNVGAGAYVLPAFNYLKDRFAGKPAPDTCPRGG